MHELHREAGRRVRRRAAAPRGSRSSHSRRPRGWRARPAAPRAQAKGAAASARARSSTTERLNGGSSGARTRPTAGRPAAAPPRRRGSARRRITRPSPAGTGAAPAPTARGRLPILPPCPQISPIADNSISPRVLQGTRCALHLLAEVGIAPFPADGPAKRAATAAGGGFHPPQPCADRSERTKNSTDPASGLRPDGRREVLPGRREGAHRPDAATVSRRRPHSSRKARVK